MQIFCLQAEKMHMKQLSALKKGEVRLAVDSTEDLWYLSQIIEKGDLLKSKTVRKVKIGGEEERKQAVKKVSASIMISVEKVEFHEYSNMLRVSGTILEAPEDVPKGSYHTLSIEEGTAFTITKENWLKYQTDWLKEACAKKDYRILLCILDREEAIFALLKRQGYKILSEIKGDVQKKGFDEKKPSFYSELIKLIQDYTERHSIQKIIVASPAFWKEELLKEIKNNKLKSMITQATCSSVSKNAIEEVMKRPELKEVLKQERFAKEANKVEELLVEISKNNLAAYGVDEVEKAISSGAVKELLITDSLIRTRKNNGDFEKINMLMREADKMKGEIMIISSEHEGGKKLDGLGGIAALLRFKMSY